ncbi:hypothetical protein RJ639_024094, partial [Escallonia herrerae]
SLHCTIISISNDGILLHRLSQCSQTWPWFARQIGVGDVGNSYSPSYRDGITILKTDGGLGRSWSRSRAHAYDIWDVLSKKYVIEDAGTKKYAIDSFLQFQMLEEKDVSSQIHEFHLVVVELSKEEMPPLEPFVTGSLIEKLPESWSDYKSMMKHKRKDMTLEDVIVQIRIEEKNKSCEKATKAKEFTSKANLIEERHDRPHENYKRQNNSGTTSQLRLDRGKGIANTPMPTTVQIPPLADMGTALPLSFSFPFAGPSRPPIPIEMTTAATHTAPTPGSTQVDLFAVISTMQKSIEKLQAAIE